MNKTSKTQRLRIISTIVSSVAIGVILPARAADSSSSKPTNPPPPSAAVTAPAQALSDAFAAVAAYIEPAVVSVYSEKMTTYQSPQGLTPFGEDFFRRFFGGQVPGTPSPRQQPNRPKEYKVPERGMGSGMILDPEGHILTNYHVVSDVDEIKVKLADARQFEAEVVGIDPQTDVAVIKIKGKVPDDLPTVKLGNSDALKVGELVMAAGAPFGLIQSITTGIISAKGRADVGISDYEDFLQTDAPINPGNSGGPLVNLRGEVIGMNSAIATSVGQSAGVGFAIPVNMIKTVLPTLLQGGKVTRGMLGVIIQNLTPQLAQQFKLSATQGALVAQVNRDSPAEKAGIESGDVIVKFEGKSVANVSNLRNLVAATAPGTKAKLSVIRDGKEKTIPVKVGELTSEIAATFGQPGKTVNRLGKLGLTAQTLTPALAKEFALKDQKGVLITDVDPGSPADEAKLIAGDVIVEAERQKVSDVNDLENVLAKTKNKGSVLLRIKRKGTSLFVALALK